MLVVRSPNPPGLDPIFPRRPHKERTRMSSTDLVERGVYTMPFQTETGGMVLVSVTSKGRRLRMTEIPAGDNPLPGLEMLWAELDAKDPAPRPMLVATA